MDISSDESDDWFMESLNAYRDLHLFQLEHPTKVIEWMGDKSICVAGYTGARSEILELLLPLKLYAGDNQGLCAERDFKVKHGGFSEEPVECLIHIPGTRCLVTSGNSNTLQIWDIGGDDSDVIKMTRVINLKSPSAKGSKITPGFTNSPTVLHGSCISDIQLTEIATGRVLHTVGKESSDSVSGLQFVNAFVFLICSTNGALLLGDTRDPSTCHYPLEESNSGLRWSFGLRSDSSQSEPSCCKVARLSSSGHMLLSDLRDLKSHFCQTQIKVPQSASKNHFMNISWAPVLDKYLSVSGFDGTVHIYNTNNWSTESSSPQPIFSHRGHKMSQEAKSSTSPAVVTAHSWHPSRPKTLLSAATDGSLHVWDWVDKITDR